MDTLDKLIRYVRGFAALLLGAFTADIFSHTWFGDPFYSLVFAFIALTVYVFAIGFTIARYMDDHE
jgi:hypothetical protein